MILIAGLGNPGEQYKNTRHNIGFDVVDAIAAHFDFPSFTTKFSSLISTKLIGSNKITLLKPQTFMNLSGDALSKATHFYKIPSEDVIIIHDDLDLAFTKVKMKIAGGSGGHNGIKSIDQHIEQEYYRVRIGIGKPVHKDVSNFVLNKFSKDEDLIMKEVISKLIDNFDLMIAKDLANFMNKLSMENKNEQN